MLTLLVSFSNRTGKHKKGARCECVNTQYTYTRVEMDEAVCNTLNTVYRSDCALLYHIHHTRTICLRAFAFVLNVYAMHSYACRLIYCIVLYCV